MPVKVSGLLPLHPAKNVKFYLRDKVLPRSALLFDELNNTYTEMNASLIPFFTTLIFALIASPTHETKREIFPENSIGVAYLDHSNDEAVSLTIRFPNFSLPDEAVTFDPQDPYQSIPLKVAPQTILLFDEGGELISLEKVEDCTYKLWCENDGGIQFEPTYQLTLPKHTFDRLPTVKDPTLGKICSFALINPNLQHLKTFYPPGVEQQSIKMRGRLSTDYSRYAPDMRLWELVRFYDRNVQIRVIPDEAEMAGNCIFLEPFNSRLRFELGCCGP